MENVREIDQPRALLVLTCLMFQCCVLLDFDWFCWSLCSPNPRSGPLADILLDNPASVNTVLHGVQPINRLPTSLLG
jgi:hypothetical protein